MVCTKGTIKKAGLNIWANGNRNDDEAEVDIIAVQGLGADPYYTWVKKPDLTQPKKSGHLSLSRVFQKRRAPAQEPSNAAQTVDGSEVMWLQDLLPNFVPNARIASYSYESNWRQDVKTNLRKCGEQFLNVLHQNRVDNMERQRPLIMIGHSLGGLVIKQALVLANHGDLFKDIRIATTGIIFLGTPHQGSSAVEYGIWLARALGNDTALLETLKKNSPTLLEVAQDFEASYSNVDIICFYEKRDGLMGIQFVDHQSASLNGKRRINLDTDHSGLNKYLSLNDENFLLVKAEICRMAQEAPQTIKERYRAKEIVEEENKFQVAFSLKGIPAMDKFVGRISEIITLAQLLISSTISRKICLLHGIGGVGKSQLAVEFARKHQKDFSAVFWIAGNTKDMLKRSIATIALRLPQDQIREMGSKDPIKDFEAIVTEVLNWFSKPSNNKWLLIFDNVDLEYSAQCKDLDAFDIKEYLPEADHGSILITSRLASMWRLAGSDIKLEPFDEAQGELLLNAILQKRLPGSLELVNLLQGLPLAIDQAGSYIRETGINAHMYMKLYKEAWGKLMTQQHEFALQQSTAPTILTTWTVSFNELQTKSPDAANLLILWAFLENQDIWYELFTPALDLGELPDWFARCVGDQFEFKKCTRFLIQYSFVIANMESLSFSVHSVLHRWCFYHSDNRKIETAWLAIMVVASAVPIESDTDYILLQRRLWPHCNRVYSLLHQTIPKNTSTLSLSNACHFLAKLYLDQNKMVEAEAMYLRALAGREKAWGPDHTSTLDTVNNLGVLYSDQGKIAMAEAMYLRALAGREKASGPNHIFTLDTVHNLGSLYRKQGKMTEAETMYLRALAGYEKACGPDNTSTLNTVHNLGNLYSDQNKMGEAETMYLRALAGREKAWGPDHTFTLDTLNGLGILYREQGKMAEAEAIYLRVLAGREKSWGPNHTTTLKTVNNLGILYSDQGKMVEAEAMYLRALAGKTKAWGPDHTSTLDTVNNLGVLYLDQGKMAEAEAMYLQALAGNKKAWGPDHTFTLDTLNNLGILYWKQGKIAEAEGMYLRALAGREKARGPDHTLTLETVNNLGALYLDQNKMVEAEAMCLRALTGREAVWGPDHTSTLDTVNNLGVLYWKQGKIAEAEAMYLRALTGRERARGPDHPSTLDTVNNLGVFYWKQGKMAEAEVMYQRALAGREKAWGLNHTSTLETVNNLGTMYWKQGKMAEAEAMYLRALAGKTKAWGPDHKSTLDTRFNLALLFQRKLMLQEAAKHFEVVVQGYTKLFGPEHPKTIDASRRLKRCEGGDGGNGTGDLPG